MADIAINLKVDGEKAYKQALANAKAEAKALQAQIDTLSSSMSKGNTTEEQSAKKAELLAKQQANLQKQSQLLQQKLDEVTEEFGDNSTQAYKLQEQLAKLEKQQNELEDSTENLSNTTNDSSVNFENLTDNTSEASNSSTDFSEVLATLGTMLKDTSGKSGGLTTTIASMIPGLGTATAKIGSLSSSVSGVAGTLGTAATAALGVVAAIVGVTVAAAKATIGLDKFSTKTLFNLYEGLADVTKIAAEGAVELGKFVAAAVEDGGAVEQSIGGIEKLYGDSADIVKSNALKAVTTTGQSYNDYLENATTLSAKLISDLGDQAEAADVVNTALVQASDNANTYGTDLETVVNVYKNLSKEQYTTLDNLNLGYAGTKEGMEQLIADANEYAISIGESGDMVIDSFSD